jgi:hypothetical protein
MTTPSNSYLTFPQTEYSELFAAICYGLHHWSNLEFFLSQLFMELHDVDTLNQTVMQHVIDQVISLEVRLSMIDVTVKNDTRISEDFRTAWNSTKHSVTRKYKNRHKLAHFSIVENRVNDQKPFAEIYPFYTVSKLRTKGLEQGLQTDQVNEIVDGIILLKKRIKYLVQYVEVDRGRLSIDQTQAANLADLIVHPFVQTRATL